MKNKFLTIKPIILSQKFTAIILTKVTRKNFQGPTDFSMLSVLVQRLLSETFSSQLRVSPPKKLLGTSRYFLDSIVIFCLKQTLGQNDISLQTYSTMRLPSYMFVIVISKDP